jgi:hypothetical protein
MRRLLLVLAACSSPPAPQPAPSPRPVQLGVLDQAMHVLRNARSTAYTHKTTIDEAEGRYELDCSGFVGYVLAKSQPSALAELRGATKRRPLAKHFVEFFQNLPAGSVWHEIQRVQDLAPGDVIAWLKPDDVTTKNTGHVMIVRAAPVRDVDYTDVWAVPIIDSTAVPHGKGDSRKDTGVTGLGTGEVLLVVDEHDVPIAYRWSRGTKATLHETTIALAGVRTQRTSTR